MKQLVPISLVVLAPCLVLAQGTVNFSNSVLTEPPNRRVYTSSGGLTPPIVGTNFVAQLYYGAQGMPADSLQPVTAAPARFRPPGTGDGLWLGGNRTLVGFTEGMIVTLQVRAWDTDFGITYNEAKAHGGWWGDSAPFTYRVPPSSSVPSDFYMENFRGFATVPEPSVFGLALLGVMALWLRRGRVGNR